ncbi:hypothetical protein B0H16DRAFT_1396476 [Mycena metata]|uniref:UBA domain-containing protein n=1 Tax=Mycena metata TaxID=1033252 RepID=A0AAD7DV08_9AGAR|nr:hypothetical protein B0H16DRAFT_1396476 [Mycena metata]
MSDSFAELWNTTAPAKPAPQKLGTASPQPSNIARRPQNDVFAMLSSASTPSNSRPITPNTRPVAQQKPSQSSSSGGDAFSSLLGGPLASNGNGMANMTIAERAKRVEEERLRKASVPPPKAAPSAWDGLDSLAAGPSMSAAATATPQTGGGLLDDDDWGFASAPVPAPTTKKSPSPALVFDEDPIFGFDQPPPKSTSPPQQKPQAALWDQLDDFASSKPSPPARYASPSTGFDFGDREDNANANANGDDNFDLLGDLGKPVEAISSRRSTPQLPARDTPSPAAPAPRRKPQPAQGRSASPPPHVLGQLIEMGFSIPQSRGALADVYRDGTWDVQAAIDALLASTGGAEGGSNGNSRRGTPPRGNGASRGATPPLPPRRMPAAEREAGAQRDGGRERERERTTTPTIQSDILARTSELGFSLFKNAERAWLQGKAQVQKVYEERMGGEEATSGRSGERERGSASGRTAAGAGGRARPKWMTEDREEPEEAGPSARAGRRAREDGETLFADEDGAQRKDDGWGNSGAGGWKDDDDEAAGAPKSRKSAPAPEPPVGDLFGDAPVPAPAPAQSKPYVSRFRHGKPSSQAPPPAVAAPRAAPTPAAPPRPHIPLPPSALRASRAHAAAANEKIALGQYGAALTSFTLAIDALPTAHVLRAPLLNARASARIKEGDFRGVEGDVEEVEGICTVGGSRAVGAETVRAEDVEVELGREVVEGWKRRAEAREGRERWEEAGRDWEKVAGAGWAKTADRDEGVRGAGRCRKMAAPVASSSSAPAPPKPKPKPQTRPPARAGSLPPSEALTKFRQAVTAAEEEDLAKHALKDTVDGRLLAWKGGKETNIRALLASLDIVLWPEIGLAPSGMKDLVTPGQVKVRYVKAIAKLHPDKLNTNNSTLEQRMIANGVFGALNEAWNAFK